MCKRLDLLKMLSVWILGKNGTYKITEIKLANRKYPVIASNSAGKSYKFTVSNIKTY
jgi:hypothetical protein